MNKRKLTLQPNLQSSNLWQFALQYYSKSARSRALLQLQDKYAANINLCLLLKYLSQQNIIVSTSTIAVLHAHVTEFSQKYTQPLRQIRANFKQSLQTMENYSVLRTHMLNAELELEKQEQQLLIDAFNRATTSDSPPSCPLKYYLESILAVPKTDLDQTLTQLA